MKTEMTRINGQNRGPRLAMILCLLLLSGPGVRASDTDKDFMEDSWELIHGLDPNDANDAFFDLDQDSFANLCEYLHASDPNHDGSKPAHQVTMIVPTEVGNIQHAIDMSIDGDTVLIQPGSYQENLLINDKEIYVTGSAPHDPATVAATIINPNNMYYDIVTFMSSQKANSTLEGLTLSGGQMGINCQGLAAPVIAHCVIAGNASTGLYINGHTDAEVTVSHCRIMENASDGIVCRNSCLDLRHTVVAKNGNEWSTAVYLYGAAAGSSGIHNCSIVGHGYRGIRAANTGTELPDISNCIVWDNGDDLRDCSATFSCIQDGDPGQGNRTEDPRFVNAAANDFRILSGSLCIDAGAPWTDYSAEPAPHGNRVNMGAYGNSALAALATDADGDGISDNWERHYWPADDPVIHGPDDDADADGFDNRTEYLYGYDPTIISQAALGIVNIQVAPEQFDPTAQQALTIRYWLNTDANTSIHISAHVDPNHSLQSVTQNALAGENVLQWNGCDANGDVLEKGWYLAVADANASGTLSQAQSNTSELCYDHEVPELLCQPQRFFPWHNDISRISYRAIPDAQMIIRIYDPTGNPFCSFTIDASDPNEILWQGTDRGLGDPTGRYLTQPGTYRIEARFQGMHEKNQTTVEAYP